MLFKLSVKIYTARRTMVKTEVKTETAAMERIMVARKLMKVTLSTMVLAQVVMVHLDLRLTTLVELLLIPQNQLQHLLDMLLDSNRINLFQEPVYTLQYLF
jgi:hypothetical protein